MDLFPVLWLSGCAILAIVLVAILIHDIKKPSAPAASELETLRACLQLSTAAWQAQQEMVRLAAQQPLAAHRAEP